MKMSKFSPKKSLEIAIFYSLYKNHQIWLFFGKSPQFFNYSFMLLCQFENPYAFASQLC